MMTTLCESHMTGKVDQKRREKISDNLSSRFLQPSTGPTCNRLFNGVKLNLLLGLARRHLRNGNFSNQGLMFMARTFVLSLDSRRLLRLVYRQNTRNL
jgi:hypothetical protein